MTEPKRGWFSRLTEGLTRSSKQIGEQITQVFVAKEPLDQAKLDELEEMLIEADLGPHSAARIAQRFSDEKFGKDVDESEIKEALATAIGEAGRHQIGGIAGSSDRRHAACLARTKPLGSRRWHGNGYPFRS